MSRGSIGMTQTVVRYSPEVEGADPTFETADHRPLGNIMRARMEVHR
jgi:hypothetical protein